MMGQGQKPVKGIGPKTAKMGALRAASKPLGQDYTLSLYLGVCSTKVAFVTSFQQDSETSFLRLFPGRTGKRLTQNPRILQHSSNPVPP